MVLSQTHQTNLSEVELAMMAQEKGSTNGVRTSADQLIQDHSNFDQTIVAMAQNSGNLKAVRRSAHETADEKTAARLVGRIGKACVRASTSSARALVSSPLRFSSPLKIAIRALHRSAPGEEALGEEAGERNKSPRLAGDFPLPPIARFIQAG